MKFDPRRGGHAPGHLRDALIRALEAGMGADNLLWWDLVEMEFFSPAKQAWWERATSEERANWLLGQLWNCTDSVPAHIYRNVGFPHAGSYARLARGLKAELRQYAGISSTPDLIPSDEAQ